MAGVRFETCLRREAQMHPSLQPRDALKLCYQASHGAEHLLQDRAGALAFFQREWEGVEIEDGPLYERISPRYVRLRLGAWKGHRIPPMWLFQLFYLTASAAPAEHGHQMRIYLDVVGQLAREGALPFDETQWECCRNAFETGDGSPVHHSEAYHTAEKPAYRVADASCLSLLPLLEAMAEHSPTGDVRTVAIDGRAAAGKTTLAAKLSAVVGAPVIHMDDFFLPPELRTQARLETPGGNVHHERFAAEVLPYLHRREAFSYTAFDCSTMTYGAKRPIEAADWRIVEGSYSCHPALGDYAVVRVFCDVKPVKQLQRIRKRNGLEMTRKFAGWWIPMEERYFDAFSVRAAATCCVCV